MENNIANRNFKEIIQFFQIFQYSIVSKLRKITALFLNLTANKINSLQFDKNKTNFIEINFKLRETKIIITKESVKS